MGQYLTKSGAQISYDSKKENAIKENLKVLLISIKAGNFLAGFHVSPPLLLISSLLNISEITDEDVIASLVFSAGIDVQGEKEVELPAFFEAVGRSTQRYLNRPNQEFHLVFPLNYKREKVLTDKFTINKFIFDVMEWKDMRSKYDINSLSDEVRKFIRIHHDPIYWHEESCALLIRIYERSAEEAFRRAEKAYDILIASINYLLDKSIKYQFGRNAPLASVLPAVGYGVFLPSGNLDCPFIDTEHLNFQTLCVEDLDFTRLVSVINLSDSENRIDHRFLQGLNSHNEGLETTQWDAAFLSFWRVMEILAFGQRTDYNMNEVVRRICVFLTADNPTKDFLNLCASRRNSLVHQGVLSSEGQPLVLTLKYFSNICLQKFEKLIQEHRTEQSVERYFEMAGLSTDQLEEYKKVVENILKKRTP
jgi:hypothetical protein